MESPTVLVLGCNPNTRAVVYSLAESVGLWVQCQASAEEFLNRVMPTMPGCLVLEARLPDVDEIEFCRSFGGFPASSSRDFHHRKRESADRGEGDSLFESRQLEVSMDSNGH